MTDAEEESRAEDRRIKRDLRTDELETVLENELANEYPDYIGNELATEYPDYIDDTDYYQESAREAMAERELEAILEAEIAKEREREILEAEEYPDYSTEYGYEPSETDYDYPPEELSIQDKLNLMGYLNDREHLENEGPYGYGPSPDYPEPYEPYEAAEPVYKRQYMSFVPGSKRSGQFYPAGQ